VDVDRCQHEARLSLDDETAAIVTSATDAADSSHPYGFDSRRPLRLRGDWPAMGAEVTRDRGVMPELRRRLRLLDLIPSLPLDAGNSFEYTVETGGASGIDAAAETAEGAIKPSTSVDFPDAEAQVKTIAVWTKVRRQQLADVPTLDGLIRNRLTHMVLRRLEHQILSGNGSGENLTGLYDAASGLGSVTFDAGELDADQALEGIVDVLLAEGEPNGVAIHPRNWANLRKAKADTGDGHYYSGGPFSPTNDTLWDVPAIRANGAIVDRPLVGDFDIGATVFVREGVNIRVSDSDQDDFLRNRVTVLAEGRFALAIWVPGAFSIVELTA
jgi:HK97 family phage major capsid protein